jgi:hypothetical protein
MMTASLAVAPLASGEPPINFAAHQIRAGNIAGAREDFQQMLAMLVAAIHPGARLIAANPGDWGIDVLVGDLSGLVVVWQAKYFWPMANRPKQSDIRSSFAAAVRSAEAEGYRIDRWTLCVPCSFDGPTAKWWDRWSARKQQETGIIIDVWHETTLRSLLITPDAAHVRRHFYDPYAQAAIPSPRRPPVSAVPDQDASRLDTALFVRQLREAGHVEVAAAKHEFFNAELLVRDIIDKGVPEELDALAECDAIVLAIWESRFNEHVARQPADPLLTGLYPDVMHDVRESVHAFPARLPNTVVHRCGMLHRLVEQRRAGWVPHWREVAARYHGQTTAGEASP